MPSPSPALHLRLPKSAIQTGVTASVLTYSHAVSDSETHTRLEPRPTACQSCVSRGQRGTLGSVAAPWQRPAAARALRCRVLLWSLSSGVWKVVHSSLPAMGGLRMACGIVKSGTLQRGIRTPVATR
jgi:hypothetical protein